MTLHCADLPTLRRRGTMKWATTASDVIPMWIAESDFTTCPAVVTALHHAMERETFGYPAPVQELSEAFADFAQDRYQWAVDPTDVHALADVVTAVILCIEHFTPAGSDIILPIPAYHPFFEALTVTHRNGRFVPMLSDDSGFYFDLEAIEREFATGASAMIVCNPYNPLGAVFSREHLSELAAIADRFGARLISDEIHAPLVYEGRHIPTASVSEQAANVTITATATSKGWNTAGLKCAQLILSNATDRRSYAQINPLIKSGASTLGIAAATGAYREGRNWLDEEIEYLKSNRRFAYDQLSEIPGVTPVFPDATYLMWVDFNGTTSPVCHDPATWLHENAKVRLSPGSEFSASSKNCVRLNFATSKEILSEAMRRIALSLRKS